MQESKLHWYQNPMEKNAREFPEETALVEINPQNSSDIKQESWKEFNLVEMNYREDTYRREITWRDFDCRANRFAHLLLANGVKKGDKVGILLMNCLEWLPIYFGILKTGAVAVPLNFRYASDEIKYCLELAEASILVFGPEFIDRVELISDSITNVKLQFFVGENCPAFAKSYEELTAKCSDKALEIL